MLKWKPANTKETVLKIQHLIIQYPSEIDWRQPHYYVTQDDIAAELEKDVSKISKVDIDHVLGDAGLKLDREVYDLSLPSEATIGFFVPESALLRIGIRLPAWPSSRATRWGSRVTRSLGP
jgi:hypothetical protein